METSGVGRYGTLMTLMTRLPAEATVQAGIYADFLEPQEIQEEDGNSVHE
jgi:hypothetical protein